MVLILLTCRFKLTTNDFGWLMIGVYAPNCNQARHEVFWEVGVVRSLFTGPWVIEVILILLDLLQRKKNFSRTSTYMSKFSDFIEDMELIDPQLDGRSYTWTRGNNLETSSRIDRFLYSIEWGENFNYIKQEILPRICSDHTPIALQSRSWEHKNSYFKFEGWWLETEGFNEKVEVWWDPLLLTEGHIIFQ